jgi:hypothetical protein
MGIRRSGPLGLYRHIEQGFDPSFAGQDHPLRPTPPGPLGTYRWNDAVAARRNGSPGPSGNPLVPSTKLDYETLYRDILKWEGIVRYMYLDTHKPPLVTVGVGNMLPDVSAAQALPFINTDTQMPATKEEIAAAFHKVASMTGGLKPVTRYKQKPSVEISVEKSKELALTRLEKEFIPGIRDWVNGFDKFPLPAREALIDMAYNGGVGQDPRMVKGVWHKATGLHDYTALKRAVERGDWSAAAIACHNKSSRPERYAWRKNLFEEAGRIAARAKGSR